MNVQIDIAGADAQGRVFLGWAPVQATAKIVDGSGAPADIVLGSAGTGGGLVFDAARSDSGTGSLPLSLPGNGDPVSFFIAGQFGKPSSAFGDAVVQATDSSSGAVLGSKALMVRIRKNAQTLPAPERDRYLAAMGTLNAQGGGPYRFFRDMHTSASNFEMHGNVGFLPWHRGYVLALERALQNIDPAVAVPYWRFDQAAPAIFTQDFMGAPNGNNAVKFRPGHALEHWVTSVQSGITRNPRFNLNSAAFVISETATLGLGTVYADFSAMEGNPHGNAHTSFSSLSPIFSVPVAVGDPLFFMLHANVDRLWAKWQNQNQHTDSSDPDAFADPDPDRIGHHLPDTMWPWNGITTAPRPPTAPGGPFPSAKTTPAPGQTPTVQSMLDYLAVNGGDPLGYAYDDVPFKIPPTVVAGGS